ncbi:MAG: Uncharacterized protein F083_2391 [bacterium F083]|mgnify:CR=1 FL=1|nr:MAG: Uncharacterized protein F083_2391 [bacterium F083]
MDYYHEIKEQLINNEIHNRVKDYSKNRSDLNTYYNVGKLLSDAGKHYGEGIIKEYSARLTNDLGKGYSQRNLRNMRQFYKVFENWQTVSAKLSWSHYCEILWFDCIKLQYYLRETEQNNLSIRELRARIRSLEFERLPEETKKDLMTFNNSKISDFIKNPIIIKNNGHTDISEKVLQKLILEDIPSFMKELGEGFCFIDNEYKIKIGDRYNYIDLLFYNIKFNCYVVVELKITELRKEHIGQIETYMNYIDKHLKRLDQDSTIGIIICKKNNYFIMEYCSDSRILSKEYKIII